MRLRSGQNAEILDPRPSDEVASGVVEQPGLRWTWDKWRKRVIGFPTRNKKRILAAVTAVLAVIVVLLWELWDAKTSIGEVKDQAQQKNAKRHLGTYGYKVSMLAGQSTSVGWAVEVERADPTGELRLEGQVLEADDLPAPESRVTVLSRPVKTVKTELDGTFVVEGLLPISYLVHAQKGDSFGGPVMHTLSATSEPLIIRLCLAGALLVEVFDADRGRPIRDGEVELRLNQNEVRMSYTDEGGIVRFSGVPSQSVMIAATAEGYARAVRLFDMPGAGNKPIRLRLPMVCGSEVTGRVVDEGRPVPGARVMALDVSRIENINMVNYMTAARDGAFSDAQGFFTLGSLAPGSYRFLTSRDGYAPAIAGPRSIDAARRPEPIEIVLFGEGIIRGRVIDTNGYYLPFSQVRTGAPATDPERMTNQATTTTAGWAVADREGRFELRRLPRRKIAVAAVAEGAVSEETIVDLEANPIVEELVLMLSVKGTIEGTVVSSAGEPVPEAVVSATASYEDGSVQRARLRGAYRQTLTGGGGRFMFSGLVEGTYILRATKLVHGYVPDLGHQVEAHTGDLEVRIVLDEPGRISGRLRFEDGSTPHQFVVWTDKRGSVPVESEQGTFEIGEIPPGDQKIAFQGPGFDRKELGPVTVRTGELTDLGTIVVGRGRAVRGQVVDEGGTFVEGATVVCGPSIFGESTGLLTESDQFGDLLEIQTTVSDAKGKFQLVGASTQRHLIVAEHARFGRSRTSEVPEGSTDFYFTLTLHSAGSLGGHVTINGEPAASITVDVRPVETKGQSTMVLTGANGAFEIYRLAPGEYMVQANPRLEYDRISRKTATVRSGEHTTVDIETSRGDIQLDVKLRATSEPAATGALLQFLPGNHQVATGGQLKSLVLSFGGTVNQKICYLGGPCSFGNLEPGHYTLCAVPFAFSQNEPDGVSKLKGAFESLKVYCSRTWVAPEPALQTTTTVLPIAEPLP